MKNEKKLSDTCMDFEPTCGSSAKLAVPMNYLPPQANLPFVQNEGRPECCI